MKTNSKKDSAVSPVIGTILLVAITVVLVAIISAVVMGMTGNIGSSKVVGVQVSLNDNNQQAIVTITGGADQKSLMQINAYQSGVTAPILTQPTSIAAGTPVPVGVPYTTARTNAMGDGKKTVTVVGTFQDGTTQTIYTGDFIFVKVPTT